MLKRILLAVAVAVPSHAVPADGLSEAARSLQDYAVSIRRAIHQQPELRWKEDKTLARIEREVREALEKNANAPRTVFRREFTGGLVIDVGEGDSRTLFRADVDALPLVEATGVPYASKVPGVMHACGHDAHAAMLLAALKGILERRVEAKRGLRFVFQRAEENPSDESGGARLVREGVLEDVGEVYGLHVSQSSPSGQLLSRAGPTLANSDRFRVKITCQGGHVANPERGSSAIDVMTDIHVALRGVDRRLLGASEPCSIVPAVSNAGSTPNTRPAEGEIWYAARHYLPEEARENLAVSLRKRVEGAVAGYPDAKMEFEYVRGHPALFNDAAMFDRDAGALRKAGLDIGVLKQDFAGDDLAHYLRKRPGSYWALGVRKEGAGSLHTPRFDMDENAMSTGILFWLSMATR